MFGCVHCNRCRALEQLGPYDNTSKSDLRGQMGECGERTRGTLQQWKDCAYATQARRARGCDRRQWHMRDQSCCGRPSLCNLESDGPREQPTSVDDSDVDRKYLRAAFLRLGSGGWAQTWACIVHLGASPGKRERCNSGSETGYQHM